MKTIELKNNNGVNSLIIIANGEYPSHPALLEILHNAECRICCDGAADTMLENGLTPDYIVGDMDSISDKIKNLYPEKLIEAPDQDSNDLSKAFTFAKSLNPAQITILGATGKREDHAIANISLLEEFSQMANVVMLSDYGKFTAIRHSTTFSAPIGTQVSIFALDSGVELSSQGLRYPLDGVTLNNWWRGTLNETVSKQFSIILAKPARIIVYMSPLSLSPSDHPF